MGYAAARGGRDAIEAAERLIADDRRNSTTPELTDDQLVDRLRAIVDRVMGEGGLWEPVLVAAAVRQAEGDPIEAAHLVRSHRSTMPRFAYSEPIDADEIEIVRRVVPAYQRPPGPQLLGRTSDYTGRLLDLTPPRAAGRPSAASAPHRSLRGGRTGVPAAPHATAERADRVPERRDDHRDDGIDRELDRELDELLDHAPDPPVDRSPRRLLDLLRELDLAVDRRRHDDPDPVDITRHAVRPPAPRSTRLSVMARAETGALVNLWYRNVLGPDGYLHEITLGEVRHGRLPVRVRHPHTGRPVRIGTVRVTEVEAIEDLDGVGEDRTRFDVGYGMCLGHNEKKAIAMANLDIACHRDGGRSQLEQSILMTTDGLDATGFLEHLKLPHYVTFRSMIERKLAVRDAARTVSGQPGVPSSGGRR